jgi:hypothetical protein
MEVAILVVDGCVGEGAGVDVAHAELGIPLTVEIVYFEAPFLAVLEFIDYCFKVSAVGAVGSEIFYKLE